MAGVTLTIDAKQVDRVSKRLHQILNNLADPRELLDEIGGYLVSSTHLRFEDTESPAGEPWAEWSEATQARRAGGVILTDTERLSDSITHQVGKDQVEIGTNVLYAGVHQLGAAKGAFGTDDHGRPIPWGDIPARPYLGLSGDDEAEVLKIIDEWASRQLEAA